MSQDDAEIYIIPKDFLKANEKLKDRTDMDAVSLSQALQGVGRAARQVWLPGFLGTAYVKVIRGKENIVFKGPPGLRPRLQATRLLRTNPIAGVFVVGSREIIRDAAKATKK
jgi:hypothetical protein